MFCQKIVKVYNQKMENVIITNKEKLAQIKAAMKKGGAGNLHILADFDQTLTKVFVNGCFVPSLISVLRDGDYLTPEYRQKAHELYNKYQPVEQDPAIPIPENQKRKN